MRLIILDTGTLGLLTHPRARPDALACRRWAQARLAAGDRVIIPGIADYELRRELIRAGKMAGLRRLDVARAGFEFNPITQDACSTRQPTSGPTSRPQACRQPTRRPSTETRSLRSCFRAAIYGISIRLAACMSVTSTNPGAQAA